MIAIPLKDTMHLLGLAVGEGSPLRWRLAVPDVANAGTDRIRPAFHGQQTKLASRRCAWYPRDSGMCLDCPLRQRGSPRRERGGDLPPRQAAATEPVWTTYWDLDRVPCRSCSGCTQASRERVRITSVGPAYDIAPAAYSAPIVPAGPSPVSGYRSAPCRRPYAERSLPDAAGSSPIKTSCPSALATATRVLRVRFESGDSRAAICCWLTPTFLARAP